LTAETKRREEIEKRAGSPSKEQSALEDELEQLRTQLLTAQRDLEAQEERSRVEQKKIEARTQELRAAHADVGQQVQRLNQALTDRV